MSLDLTIYEGLVTSTVCAVVCLVIFVLARKLDESRSGLSLLAPLFSAFAIRIIAALGIELIPPGQALRGGDEVFWLDNARAAANAGLVSPGSLDLLVKELHSWVFSIGTYAVSTQPDLAFRLIQITFSVCGIALVAAAAYDLAGRRAAAFTVWLLAFEPSSIFFSSILHKEPLLMLAGGLVALGGVRIWKRGELVGLLPMAAGCLIAVATRPYAGWFFIAAGLLIAFHGSVRHAAAKASTVPLAALLAVAIVAAVPVVWNASDEDALPAQLQSSQNANAANDAANLSLEQVDFSSRGAILTNLPIRIRDVLLRPYPWQVGNLSQQLGVIGGLITLAVLYLLLRYMWLSRGQIMARAGPFIYLGTATLIAYSLSAGNAGTAFRYRTHILLFGIAAMVVLREYVLQEREARAAAPLREKEQGPESLAVVGST